MLWHDPVFAHHPVVIEEHVHVLPPAVSVVPAPILHDQPSVVSSLNVPNTSSVDRCEPRQQIWEPVDPWLSMVGIEYGIPVDDVSHVGGELLIQSPNGWGVDTRFNLKFESLDKDVRDHLWTGDFNLTYELVRTSQFRFRAGVGINWMGDRQFGEAGPNLMVSGQWKPNDSWVLSAYLSGGTVGETDLKHVRLTCGRLWGEAELYGGVDHYQVGGDSIDTAITGLRFRF